MLTTMRNRLGPVTVTLIVGGIAAIFILSDLIAPRKGAGLSGGLSRASSAGTVDGESISISEFNRELGRRVEQMKQFTGGRLTDEQLKMFRIHES
ncbi:MAG: SurA N-terminal domain-containing protein, partial [Oligoflexia bacterium]